MLLPDAGNALANSRGNSPLSLSLPVPLSGQTFSGLPLVTCGRNCFCRRKW